jgi:hypothetical protein
MYLCFADDDLRVLCNTRALLERQFGDAGSIVERRLLVLSNAKALGDVTKLPPDRRRLEPKHGSSIASVCARAAGRIYFRALDLKKGAHDGAWEEVQEIEILSIRRVAE